GQGLDHLDQRAESDDLLTGKVGDMSDAGERKQVMLADRAEADVAKQHRTRGQGVRGRAPRDADGPLEMHCRVLTDPGEELRVQRAHPRGGLLQPRAVRVLADRVEKLAGEPFDALL